ncbi:MAG: hypothetical protein MR982_10160 [Bacteroides pyogenes]|uniref:hypothetical protein n=1 Tax=Bacteroides pyogenes TaxID=310300 RepID=UPI002430D560|nr:hypothetical protein [Bacteroides pyogenes]MCI7071304.1 hypothetical protein [Bacteroides pyogenes]
MKETESNRRLRLREIRRLEERIARDEARMEEIIDLLMEKDTTKKCKETDDLINEFHNLNMRIEQANAGLITSKKR